jgi:Family of unknown function (DUF5681)
MTDHHQNHNVLGVGGFHAGQAAPASGFQPGQSGNPGGRPKAEKKLQEYACRYTFEIITGLMDIFRNSPNDACRVAAGREVLDRGHGKARQAIDLQVIVEKQVEKHVTEYFASKDLPPEERIKLLRNFRDDWKASSVPLLTNGEIVEEEDQDGEQGQQELFQENSR